MAVGINAQFAIAIYLLITTVIGLPVIPPVRFPPLYSLSILPAEDNSLLREFVSIDFVSINDEVIFK